MHGWKPAHKELNDLNIVFGEFANPLDGEHLN
jgi:hypothetical protein